MPASVLMNVRMPPADRAALQALSRRTGLSMSVLLRAGARAVVADPRIIWSAPPADYAPQDYAPVGPYADDLAGPPPPPPRRRRKRGR